MPMEDNINEVYRMRQELAIRNDDLTAQVRQLTKKVEILQSQRDKATEDRSQYFNELNCLRAAIFDELIELIKSMSDEEKIKLIGRLSKRNEKE